MAQNTEDYLQEINGRFTAQIGEWSAQGSRRAVLRRVRARLHFLEQQAIGEAKRIAEENAPKKKCPRCNGVRYMSKYAHVHQGLCFKCGGKGEVPEQSEPPGCNPERLK